MSFSKTVNIGLADSQFIFTEGLKYILHSGITDNLKVKWQVTSGKSLLKKIVEKDIDVLITDLCLEEKDAIDILTELKNLNPKLKIVIFTQYAQTKFIKDSFLTGADGYLLKSDSIENLLEAIETVDNGKTFMGDGISIGPKLQARSPHDSAKWAAEDAFLMKHKLTIREREILAEICEGKTNKEIASDLYISDQTVSVHKKNIMKKFNVDNSKELRQAATEYNLEHFEV